MAALRLRVNLRTIRVLIVALFLAISAWYIHARLTRQPNVVIIVLDSLRYDHLSCYGYGRETSPNLDRLAAEGVRYPNFYSTSSWTRPACGSLFTGLYPVRHWATTYVSILNQNALTLERYFNGKGYETIRIQPLGGTGRVYIP